MDNRINALLLAYKRCSYLRSYKECEWRFNYSSFKSQKRQLKQWAKKYLG